MLLKFYLDRIIYRLPVIYAINSVVVEEMREKVGPIQGDSYWKRSG